MTRKKTFILLVFVGLAGLFSWPSSTMAQFKKYVKPDLEVKSLELAYDDDGQSILAVEIENDSHVSISYPGYQVEFKIYRNDKLLTTVTPNFGEWKGERRKIFEFPTPMKAGTYRVKIIVDGLVGESNKDNNVLETSLAPPGQTATPTPPKDDTTNQQTPDALTLSVFPSRALAGSPVLVEASSHGRLEISGEFMNAVWTKGDGVRHYGSGVSAVISLPTSLSPGNHWLELTTKNGAKTGFDLEILAQPPRILEWSPNPAQPKQKLTVIVENLPQDRAKEAKILVGDLKLKVTSSGPMKGGKVYLTTTLPNNVRPGDLRVTLDEADSDFWWTQHLRVASVPSLFIMEINSHPNGSIILLWGEDLQSKNLRWTRAGSHTTVLGNNALTTGSTLLLASTKGHGAVEAIRGKTILGSWEDHAHGGQQGSSEPLVFSDFNPGSLRPGDTLVITGSGLNQVQSVSVGGGACTIKSITSTRLDVVIGKSCRTGAIVLRTRDQEISSELHLVVR